MSEWAILTLVTEDGTPLLSKRVRMWGATNAERVEFPPLDYDGIVFIEYSGPWRFGAPCITGGSNAGEIAANPAPQEHGAGTESQGKSAKTTE